VMDVAAAAARTWTREGAALARLSARRLALLVVTGLVLRLDDIVKWIPIVRCSS